MIRSLLPLALFVLLGAQTIFSMDHAQWNDVKNARGSFTAGVQEKTIGDKSYIQKRFKEDVEYTKELKSVLASNDSLQDYMSKKTPDMASFALYDSHTSGSIIYVKAKGETFWDFLITAATTVCADGSLNRESILKTLQQAGKAIAKFHIWFKSPSDDDTFLTCIHGDMSPSNVFFRVYNGLVTFIDYSTFSPAEKKDVNIDINKLFNSSKNFLQGVGAGIAQYIIDKKLKMTTDECLKRLAPFEDALSQGYNDALKEVNLKFTLSREGEEGRFILNKDKGVDDLANDLGKLNIGS